jgi:hypothetical protein
MKDSPREMTHSPVPPQARRAADAPETTAPLRADWPRLLAWLPLPLLLVMMAVLGAADLRTPYEFPHLLMAVDFLTRTLASLLIVYLAGRSFLVRGAPNLLLLGCGVAIWGSSGFVATSTLTNRDADLGVTISNLGIWLAALCQIGRASCRERV